MVEEIPTEKGNRNHCSTVDMAAKSRKGKSTVYEGQLLGEEGRQASLHGHWVSGTKQHSGPAVTMLPLSSQRGFGYMFTKIKELGKTTCPPVEERWAWGLGWPGHRNCYPWKQSLEDRCGGRKLTTINCWQEGPVLLPRPSVPQYHLPKEISAIREPLEHLAPGTFSL